MKIRLKEYVVQFVRNLSVHCGRKLLPYGVILAVLGGIGFFWDGGPAEEKADMREKIHADDGSSPSFSATAQHQDSKNKEGTLIFSTAAARRRKPLPELFVPPLVSAAEKTSVPPIPCPVSRCRRCDCPLFRDVWTTAAQPLLSFRSVIPLKRVRKVSISAAFIFRTYRRFPSFWSGTAAFGKYGDRRRYS